MVIVAAVGFVAELFTRAVRFRPSTERLVTTAR
jgi:hypothetical protein